MTLKIILTKLKKITIDTKGSSVGSCKLQFSWK